jgi:hypothetical protein
MRRRNFVTAATAALGVSAADAAESTSKSQIFLLRWHYMRSGPQVDRTTKFLGSAYLPAAKRAGAKTLGFFTAVIADRSPFILTLAAYPSMAAFESAESRLSADTELQKAADDYDVIGDPAYIRIESTLLRAFDAIPELTPPPVEPKHPARIFELRTYESSNEKAARRKIKMFEDAEAGIFRRLGMRPVFFGRGLVGQNLPSLTYMLAYDDLAARDKLWKDFGSDPEWQKLRAQPGLSDAEIVSNISNQILRPTPFSEIR